MVNDGTAYRDANVRCVLSRYRGVAMAVGHGSLLSRHKGVTAFMNDNVTKTKPLTKFDCFVMVWNMCEVAAFIMGIVLAIWWKNPNWLFMTLAAFALLMGGV